MRNIFESIESDTKQSEQQTLCQTIENFGKLKEIEEKYAFSSDKQLSIIKMGMSIIASDMKQLMKHKKAKQFIIFFFRRR